MQISHSIRDVDGKLYSPVNTRKQLKAQVDDTLEFADYCKAYRCERTQGAMGLIISVYF
jgi:hypothetical protein